MREVPLGISSYYNLVTVPEQSKDKTIRNIHVIDRFLEPAIPVFRRLTSFFVEMRYKILLLLHLLCV
jgi:hypothetical protein